MSDTLEALVGRARSLTGSTIAEVAARAAENAPRGGLHQKGRAGELIERALGADGGSGQRQVDFPALGVELKTIPVDPSGRPLESTFVCSMKVDEEVDFEHSWVKAKLSAVLFVPIVGVRKLPLPERRIGRPVLWRPSPEQLVELAADYDDIMGLIGIGRMEDVSAHLGRYLQLRPKARDGTRSATAIGREGERIRTVPRGFYLRAGFTAALLSDPAALPEL